MRGRIALKSCSEEKQWLMSIGIPGIERLADEFESRGFSTRKSLQYLQDGDLDYIFASRRREHWTTNCDMLNLNHKNLAVLYI